MPPVLLQRPLGLAEVDLNLLTLRPVQDIEGVAHRGFPTTRFQALNGEGVSARPLGMEVNGCIGAEAE